MEFTESIVVGIMDDDGIGIGDVDTILYDLGSYEDVILMVPEVNQDLLHLLRSETPMRHGDTGIRHLSLDECS